MKKIVLIFALAGAAIAASAQNIFVVDIAKIHQNYYKTKIVQEQWKSVFDTTNSELQRMQQDFENTRNEVVQIQQKLQNPALSEDAKREIQEKELVPNVTKLQEIEQTVVGIRNQAQERIQKNQREVIAAHRKEIVEVIEKVAAGKNADFVIEKATCYFSKPASDITEEVIQSLNANAPAN